MIGKYSFKRRSFAQRAWSTVLSAVLAATSFTCLSSVAVYAEDGSGGSSGNIPDYGLMDNIQDGTILHCFDWKYADIMAELPNIAAAGFTSVQTSPAQPGGNHDPSASTGTWWWLYQPLSFSIGTNYLGTKRELQELCTAADQYGIKIIVDIVANHLAGDHTYIQNDLKDGQYWHDVENWDNVTDTRYKTTHKDLGMPDIKSEDSYVQQCVKAYVQELKSVGVDGLRWDTLKHIQVPSEDCAFFTEVLDPEMYNYGESLGDPGGNNDSQNRSLMKEYTGLMSVTDDVYGNELRRGIASGNLVSTVGNWAYRGCDADKLVYWGESHDTWANDEKGTGGDYYSYSNLTDQNIVDRVYAITASRAGATSLYFSRPSANIKNQILAGVKGSTHFTSPEVAEVNHFHNAFVGKTEYCSKSGNIYYTERGSKGVILVNGATNGGSVGVSVTAHKMAAGTYTDHVSGSTFTVANGKISGTIGSTGIAVVYNDGDVDEPTITADTLYLVPNSDWKKDSARFAIYLFNESGNSWVSMTDNDGDGTYEAAVPSGNWTNVIFCRMNPAYSTNAWDYVWGQTNDLAPDSGMNCYTIQPGTWSGSSNPLKWSAGSWSTLTPACDHTYTVNWTWAADYSTATATLICSECSDAQPVSATVSVDYVSNIRVHTATVTFGGAAYTDVKYEPMVVQNEPDGGVDYQIENAALLAELYNTIADQHPESIDLSDRNMTVTDGEKITQALQNCFPELFYISYVSYSYSGSKLYEIIPYYSETAETAAAKVAEFYAKADWYLDQIDSSWDDYTKALVLHDLLVLNHYYQIETETEYSSNYTFMIDGWGRCENYAECYAYLLARLGIKSEIVDGTAGGAHEWLKVCLDGKWYAVDITFDDPKVNGADRPNKVSHQYFLLSDTALQNAAKPHSNFTADQYYRTDTAYDGYTSIHSNDNPIFYTNGKYYTLLNSAIVAYNTATDLLNNTNAVTAHKINDIWSAGGSSYWPGNYSSIAYYNGLIYFNGEHTINTYNPATGAVETIYTNTDIQYYGMYIKDGKIYGLTAPDPNTNPTSVEIQMQKYTVTWKNEDGTVLETDTNVAVGTTPSYDGATPTKAATAQYSYTFAGWSPAVAAVTGDVTYTATFTKTTREYTITWKMDDGSTIDTTTVAYGTTPTHADAVKDADAQYTYTFTGWTPTITAVTGEATYTAEFTATPIAEYAITVYNFIGWDTVYVYYWGGSASIAWPGEAMIADGENFAYTATIPSTCTNIMFSDGTKVNDYGGTDYQYKTGTINSGIADGAVWAVSMPSSSSAVRRATVVPTYYLVGTMNNWNSETAPVLTLTPVKNDEGKEEYTLTTTLNAGAEFKVKSSSTWYPDGSNNNYTITTAGTYTIRFRPNADGGEDWHCNVLKAENVTPYTVTFVTDGGSAVDSQTVTYGDTATEPTAPTKDGYTFTGWKNDTEDYDFSTPVTSDLTLTAQWEVNTVDIQFYDINGINTDTRSLPVVDPPLNDFDIATPPYLHGYTVNGWTVDGTACANADAVKEQLRTLITTTRTEPIAVCVDYQQVETQYSVTVSAGTIKGTNQTSGTYKVSDQVYVVANETPDQFFDCWKATYGNSTGEIIVGYDKTYAFRMPSQEITLKACYVSEEKDLSPRVATALIESVTKTGDNQISFVAVLSVPDDCTMKQAGIVAFKSTDINDAHSVPEIGYARFNRYNNTICTGSSTFKYTWTKANIGDATWCVRAYVIYQDANGAEQPIVYSEMVSGSLAMFNE